MKERYEKWLKTLKISGKPDEWEVKQLLQFTGINVPTGILITPEKNPETFSLSFPCAVKVCDPSILHKTDCGGLYLNVNEDDLPKIISKLKMQFPGSNILIEEQVKYERTEFIIGALVDPVFGPAIMFGAGGILTELYKDVTFRLAPCSTKEAERMLKELTISEVLQGYRESSMDLKSLAEIISLIGDLVVLMGDRFNQLDINPIVYGEKGWFALDGVLMLN